MTIFGYSITKIKKVQAPEELLGLSLDDWINNNNESSICIYSPYAHDNRHKLRLSISAVHNGSEVRTQSYIKANTIQEAFYNAVRLIERTTGSEWRQALPVVMMDKESKR